MLVLIDWLIEFSHKHQCQKSSPWSQGRKHHSEGKKRATYFPHKDNAEMVQKILGKTTSMSTKGGKKKKHVWLSGRLHVWSHI